MKLDDVDLEPDRAIGNTTLTYKTVQMSTPHFVMYWEELSWSPLAKEPGRAAWKYDTDVQNRADVILHTS